MLKKISAQNKTFLSSENGGVMVKYEICRQIKDGNTTVWSVIAWTDVRVYAEKIIESLNMMDGNSYAILIDGKVFERVS